MTRPTIHDVAAVAGLSLATVDRVLNNRGGVAQKSIQKVAKAVAATGYVRDIAAANLSRGRHYRFAFVLPDSATSFVSMLHAALDTEKGRLRIEKTVLTILTTKAFDTASQVAVLRGLSAENVDGVALLGTETPDVQAQIARLTNEGVGVVTLVSDMPLSQRKTYIGPDNIAAGRTAATFMGRFIRTASGTVLVIPGSLSARDHIERIMGFRMVMTERFGDLTVLPAAEGFDNAETVKQIVSKALAQGPLAGIYAVGAGNRGLLDALQQVHERPVTIVHELTGISRTALRSGEIDLVIDQNPHAEVRTAISIMRDLSDNIPVAPLQGAIPLHIYVRENIT